MSPGTSRRVLFVAALLLVPFPMTTFDAFVPVVRYLLLGAVCIGMAIAEGSGGVVWQLTALFLGHALVYGLLLFGAAWIAARAAAPLPARVRTAAVVGVVLAAALLALTQRPYVTPFGTSVRSGLIGVLR